MVQLFISSLLSSLGQLGLLTNAEEGQLAHRRKSKKKRKKREKKKKEKKKGTGIHSAVKQNQVTF